MATRDEASPMATRLEAAKAAAPYVHARLVAQHVTKNTGQLSLEFWLELQEDDDEAGGEVEGATAGELHGPASGKARNAGGIEA